MKGNLFVNLLSYWLLQNINGGLWYKIIISMYGTINQTCLSKKGYCVGPVNYVSYTELPYPTGMDAFLKMIHWWSTAIWHYFEKNVLSRIASNLKCTLQYQPF